MNNIKRLLISTTLASISICSLSGIQVFAQNNFYEAVPVEQSIMPHYNYINASELNLNVSSSGAKYSIYIQGDSITKISGTLTLYKDGGYVSSKRISENSDTLDNSGTLTASGRGNYELIFSGTVSTKNGSEPIKLSETDSY